MGKQVIAHQFTNKFQSPGCRHHVKRPVNELICAAMMPHGIKCLAMLYAMLFPFVAIGQTSYEEISASCDKAAGLYYLYPEPCGKATPAPKGYRPFYISHYGRHGSRYLVGEEQYSEPFKLMEAAMNEGKLTALGADVAKRLKKICDDAQGRSGELTAKGVKQHHDIAQRMFKNYPEVFGDKSQITAKSTTVMRCAHSMAAFCEGLKELNPKLSIPRESAQRYMCFMANVSPESNKFNSSDGEAAKRSARFETESAKPERLMSALFTDPNFIEKQGKTQRWLMLNLFRIAIDAPNTECNERLDDIFTNEECFKLWQYYNYHYYNHMSNPPAAKGAVLGNARPLLSNILTCAQEAIKRGGSGADLRFGHDSCLVPLLGLMQIEGCYGACDDPAKLHEVYADFKISPMAANLQMVLFKNKTGDVLVKFLLNEKETHLPIKSVSGPYYKWADVEKYFTEILK